MNAHRILPVCFVVAVACSRTRSEQTPPPPQTVGQASSAASEPISATIKGVPRGGINEFFVTITNTGPSPTTTWTVVLTHFGQFGGGVGRGAAYSLQGTTMTVTPGSSDAVLAADGGKAWFGFTSETEPTIVSATATTGSCDGATCVAGCCSQGKCMTIQSSSWCGTGGQPCHACTESADAN